jgi:hypothetical protein
MYTYFTTSHRILHPRNIFYNHTTCSATTDHILRPHNIFYNHRPYFTSTQHNLHPRHIFYIHTIYFITTQHILQTQTIFYIHTRYFTNTDHILHPHKTHFTTHTKYVLILFPIYTYTFPKSHTIQVSKPKFSIYVLFLPCIFPLVLPPLTKACYLKISVKSCPATGLNRPMGIR